MGEVRPLAPQPVPAPAAPRRAKRPGAARVLPRVADRAFLPAALSVVETPPSPVRMGMLVSICALTTVGLAWSWFSWIDIHAVARGKLEPAGHAKVVQPLEAGIVSEVRVADGQAVHAGEVLVVLDGREAAAELAEATAGWSAAQAEAIRRGAELEVVRRGRPDGAAGLTPPALAWPVEIPAATRAREEAVLRGDLSELSATLADLDAQEREKQAAVAQLDMSLDAERALLGREAERVDLRQTLQKDGNGSRLNLIDAEQSVLETRAQLVGDTGREAQAQAAVASLRADRQKTLEGFLADDERKLADAAKEADGKRQEQARSQARLEHSVLRAPVDGVVQALAVTNPGQVVTPSQELLRLVPQGAPLEVLAYVTNDDAGFVRPGQRAVVKLDAFPYTRYGTIEAEVVSVAADAVTSEAAEAQQGDATHAGGRDTQAITLEAKPVQNLVFATQLKLLVQGIGVDGHTMPLNPGMTVTVEINTGRRKVLEYLFSPLTEAIDGAGRER